MGARLFAQERISMILDDIKRYRQILEQAASQYDAEEILSNMNMRGEVLYFEIPIGEKLNDDIFVATIAAEIIDEDDPRFYNPIYVWYHIVDNGLGQNDDEYDDDDYVEEIRQNFAARYLPHVKARLAEHGFSQAAIEDVVDLDPMDQEVGIATYDGDKIIAEIHRAIKEDKENRVAKAVGSKVLAAAGFDVEGLRDPANKKKLLSMLLRDVKAYGLSSDLVRIIEYLKLSGITWPELDVLLSAPRQK